MNRRTATGALAALVALVLPNAAIATHDPNAGNGLRKDFAAGAGQSIFDSSLAFYAFSGPSGQHAKGYYAEDVHNTTIKVRAKVTCLNVVGNQAAFVSVLTGASSDDLPAGLVQTTYVQDSELLGDGVRNFLGEGTPGACPSPDFLAPPLLTGNVVVHDAHPR